jgi:RNA polymerase sigma factor (sigma-70 family)
MSEAAPQPTQTDFQALMDGVARGSDHAITTLVEQYGHHILRIVRRRRSSRFRSTLDSADLVQSVWRSFLRGRAALPHFDRFEQLFGFLIAIADHKVAEKSRAALRSKRDRRRELPLDHLTEMNEPFDSRTPSVILLAKERLELLLRRMPPHYQQVICRRATGEPTKEIAKALGIHERTVWKIVEYVLKSERF